MEKKQKDPRKKKSNNSKFGGGKNTKVASTSQKKLNIHHRKQHHLNKMAIRKGDFVIVITGPYKGVKGKVLKAFPQTQRVIVEKVNFIKKHTRPTQQNQQGAIVEKEAPIHVSNVMLYNDKLNEVTKAVYKTVGKDRIRVDKKTGDEI